MEQRERFLLSVLLCGLSLVSSVRAVQPALVLPPWVELSARFDEPPEMGRSVVLTGEVHCLHGEGGAGTVTFVLPPELKLIRGGRKDIVTCTAGFHKTWSITVRAMSPCAGGTAILRLRAPYPREALAREVRRAGGGSELVGARLALLSSLEGPQDFTAVARFSISPFEASAGEQGAMWHHVLRDPARKGLFLTREPSRRGTERVLRRKVETFERAEAAVNANPRLQAALASQPGARTARRAEYAEDCYALAVETLKMDPASLALPALVTKVEGLEGVPLETVFALNNIAALGQYLSGDRVEASKIWFGVAERYPDNDLMAYFYYNTGEVYRLAGQRKESRELFERARAIRPGLTIARKRLR